MPNAVGGALGGAAQGAAAGSVAGPWGAAIGGIIGGASSLFGGAGSGGSAVSPGDALSSSDNYAQMASAFTVGGGGNPTANTIQSLAPWLAVAVVAIVFLRK